MPAPEGKLITPVGFDASGDPRSLEVDGDDALRVTFETAEKGLAGEHGYIGAAWQKQPLAIGYSAALREEWEELSLPAGSGATDSSVVPAGEIWIIEMFNGRYAGTGGTNLELIVVSGGDLYRLLLQDTPVNWTPYIYTGSFVMEEGDKLRVSIATATLNDNLYGQVLGRKVDIDL